MGGSGHFSYLESAEDFWGARRFSSTSELEDDSEGDIGVGIFLREGGTWML